MIPKLLHFVWVGDESKRPDNCIDTWRRNHPDWTVRVWDNEEYRLNDWWLKKEMDAMWKRELNGVADMMRWQILYEHGGICLDADSVSIIPLPESILEHRAFACWESEIARPGLIAAGYVGSEPGEEFWKKISADIRLMSPNEAKAMAWITVGPGRITHGYRKYQFHSLEILPSHYFIPNHFTGLRYNGRGPIYATQLWGSTNRSYDELHKLAV